MKIPKKESISGVKPSVFQSILTRFPLFWSIARKKTDNLPQNKNTKLTRYDQKKDGACTVFAACGALCANTGQVMANESIRELAVLWLRYSEEKKRLTGAPLFSIVQKVCERFNCEMEVFDMVDDPIAYELLLKGYEFVGTVYVKSNFFNEGIVDGHVEITEASHSHDLVHAIRIRYTDKLGYHFVNSWGKFYDKGLHNEYSFDIKKAIETRVLDRRVYFIG